MALEASASGKKKACKSGKKAKDATPATEAPSTLHNRYQTYLSIRYNREKRALAEEKRQRGEQKTNCPVCNRSISGTDEELSKHVNRCLNGEVDDEEEVDVEGETEDFEEYTWAGQTRVRATSMLQGGVSELGSGSLRATAAGEDSDSDLDVDGDQSTMYGTGQYGEADLLPCTSEEAEEEKGRVAIRKALLQGASLPEAGSSLSTDSQPSPSSEGDWNTDSSSREPVTLQPQAGPSDRSPPRRRVNPGTESTSVIASLKAKVQELQAHIDSTEKMKCLICMDSYSKPVVSVQCWHVYCEECWLRTLGAKKLCPQCNMITSPGDLRRIFL